MKKYTSLEHTIKKVVAEQNYKKPVVDEAVSPVDYDKPKEVPQAFFKPVHIEPRKGEEQIKASGPVTSRRNLEKEKSSETMHSGLKEEEQLDEFTGVVIPILKQGLKKAPPKPSKLPDFAEPPPAPKPMDLPRALEPVPNLPAPVNPKTPTPAPKVPEASPAPARTPNPTTPAPNNKPVEPVPSPVSTPAPFPVPVPSPKPSSPKTPTPSPRKKPEDKRRRIIPSFGLGNGDSMTPNTKGGFQISGLPSRARSRITFKEQTERTEVEAVGRKTTKRSDPIVGRTDSDRSKTMTRHAEIVRKIIEDKKIIITKNKEENMGKNPLVDTEPKLKHQQLDQGSEK